MSQKISLITSFLYFHYTLLQSPANFGLPRPPTGSRQIEETYDTYLITYLHTYLLTHLLTHSLTFTLTHLLAYLLTYLLT